MLAANLYPLGGKHISWFKSKFRKLIIRYEDMLNKPDETFKKIVLFVNTLSNHEKIVDALN